MNWQDKAEEIASSIIGEIDDETIVGYTSDDVRELLRKAAYIGMQHECDNWTQHRR